MGNTDGQNETKEIQPSMWIKQMMRKINKFFLYYIMRKVKLFMLPTSFYGYSVGKITMIPPVNRDENISIIKRMKRLLTVSY